MQDVNRDIRRPCAAMRAAVVAVNFKLWTDSLLKVVRMAPTTAAASILVVTRAAAVATAFDAVRATPVTLPCRSPEKPPMKNSRSMGSI